MEEETTQNNGGGRAGRRAAADVLSEVAMGSRAAMLFLVHALLELVLGAMKLRGRYEGQSAAGPEAKFIRHHGVALLSLAMLGGLVWWRKLVDTETGKVVSMTLFAFHGGAAAVHAHAWADGSVKSASTFAMHLPFALGFMMDAMRARAAGAKSL